MNPKRLLSLAGAAALLLAWAPFTAPAQPSTADHHAIVLHAARMLDVAAGKIVAPGEVLIEGERIVAAGPSVEHPAGAQVIDLGDVTLMPGLIDAHVHLFLHPGAEDLQTVEESVPQRTILATLAARDDLTRPTLLEAQKCRINCSLVHAQSVVTHLFDSPGDAVAVKRPH